MPSPDYAGFWKLDYDWQTIVAGILAFIAGLLAYGTGRQQAKATANAAERQVVATQKAAEQQVQRAMKTARIADGRGFLRRLAHSHKTG